MAYESNPRVKSMHDALRVTRETFKNAAQEQFRVQRQLRDLLATLIHELHGTNVLPDDLVFGYPPCDKAPFGVCVFVATSDNPDMCQFCNRVTNE